jgi:predicted nuclease of predicted toxin-antitoxin system
VAALYVDECFPLAVVEALRRLGHDVLTAKEAGQANQRITDEAVIAFASRLGRSLLTLNRWDFVALHARDPRHRGIIACSPDPDVERQAAAIDSALHEVGSVEGKLVRVNRQG